ncbi:MAG: four helix bundle protein [Candidatus Margulisiibacteriota bacterium]
MHSNFKDKPIYLNAKKLYGLINSITNHKVPLSLKDQILRACMSIILNFSEGYGRFSKRDKKHFYITARASLNETVACFDLINDHISIDGKTVEVFNITTESLSRMLSGLINSQK